MAKKKRYEKEKNVRKKIKYRRNIEISMMKLITSLERFCKMNSQVLFKVNIGGSEESLASEHVPTLRLFTIDFEVGFSWCLWIQHHANISFLWYLVFHRQSFSVSLMFYFFFFFLSFFFAMLFFLSSYYIILFISCH